MQIHVCVITSITIFVSHIGSSSWAKNLIVQEPLLRVSLAKSGNDSDEKVSSPVLVKVVNTVRTICWPSSCPSRCGFTIQLSVA